MKYVLAFIVAFILGILLLQTVRAQENAPLVTAPATIIAPPSLPFRVFDELPEAVYTLSRAEYEAWAAGQNATNNSLRQMEADEFNMRNPQLDILVQDSEYKGLIDQQQGESATPNGATFDGSQQTKFSGQTTQRTFRGSAWCGGPLHILNPYAKRPARAEYAGLNELGKPQFKIVDPDRAIQSVDDLLKVLRAAREKL